MPHHSAFRCVFGIRQNNAKPLISNGLRFVVTCLPTGALWVLFHYFRHLYTIIKFVDNSAFLPFADKYKYTTMVRATLSRYELVWLFYNGLSEAGNPKFKRLVEKYSLLKNLREDLLTLSRENRAGLAAAGISRRMLLDNGYSGIDYNFWLSPYAKVPDKYAVSAFYSKSDLNEGVEVVRRMNKFLEQTNGVK